MNSIPCEQEALEALGGDFAANIVTCPKCNFAAELPAAQRVLACPQCKLETCRFCRKPSHIPFRCEEVVEKKKTDARTIIEEKMTAARIRTCPSCSARFFKVDGCNKMTCRCGKKMCYICRAEIVPLVGVGALLPNGRPNTGYAHFCETPHCTHADCGKCQLFTSSKEDDLKAVRDAGLEGARELAARVQREQSSASAGGSGDGGAAGGGDPDAATLDEQVDMSKLLEGTEAQPRPAGGVAAAGAALAQARGDAHARRIFAQGQFGFAQAQPWGQGLFDQGVAQHIQMQMQVQMQRLQQQQARAALARRQGAGRRKRRRR